MNFFEKTNNFEKYSNIDSKLLFGQRMNKCKISVMIPTYKRTTLLKECIESAIHQTHSLDYEIVIIDNTDDESYYDNYQLVRNYNNVQLSYYRNQKNIGMFGNWNRCFELANGNWVLILNDDDFLSCNYIEEMIKAIKLCNEETAIIGCHRKIKWDTESHYEPNLLKKVLHNIIYRESGKLIKIMPEDMVFGNKLFTSGALISRDYALKSGGFSPVFYPMSDYVFVLNAVCSGYDSFLLKQHLMFYRVGANESLKCQTLVSFVEIGYYAKCFLNQNKSFIKQSLFNKFICYDTILAEEQFVRSMTFNPDDEKSLKSEYQLLNEKLNIKKASKIMCFLIGIINRAYIFYVECIRKGKKK